MPSPLIALLGDSIFDNATYTAGAPDVVSHLRALLPAGWRATLLAVDGSDVLNLPVGSTAEALALFGRRIGAFKASYVSALDGILALGRRTTVCTIYEGNLEPVWAPLARVALTLFNDVILRVAFERAVDVIDLRLVCTDLADYANPIEPSNAGGQKIASAIAAAVGARDVQPGARIFGR
jgi:hypothetical protein